MKTFLKTYLEIGEAKLNRTLLVAAKGSSFNLCSKIYTKAFSWSVFQVTWQELDIKKDQRTTRKSFSKYHTGWKK